MSKFRESCEGSLFRFGLGTFTRIIMVCLISGFTVAPAYSQELELQLRYQTPTSENSPQYHQLVRDENWEPSETVIIVCDMWDSHHCLNAVRRVQQFAPVLDKVLANARERGVLIIHSPSSCMDAYANHPGRKRAIAAPPSKVPDQIDEWCYQIPSEERGTYPIDQTDGGEDDDPEEHAAWAKELEDAGLNPRAPWKRQVDLLTIDEERDYITDRGSEVWNIFEDQGIKNVILTGVHTNMCVLGRPFGLRQMVKNEKNVVLMRDMTDTMYNPGAWPYVSHFTGTDLIVSHVERHVCPTITSDQFLGGESFRFKEDTRPHVVMLIAEDEYATAETLPAFASEALGKDFRVSLLFGSDTERNLIPGMEVVQDADVLIISVRRRILPREDLALVKEFVAAGKPVIGIRTASHAFDIRDGEVPANMDDWKLLDAEVFGGNYHGHHGNQLKSTVTLTEPEEGSDSEALLRHIDSSRFPQGGSLYENEPLASGAVPVAFAEIEGLPREPVAWTFKRGDGGKSFYTSLGHVDDFANPAFKQLLVNSIYWAVGKEPRGDLFDE